MYNEAVHSLFFMQDGEAFSKEIHLGSAIERACICIYVISSTLTDNRQVKLRVRAVE
jgi:hypothetical protein